MSPLNRDQSQCSLHVSVDNINHTLRGLYRVQTDLCSQLFHHSISAPFIKLHLTTKKMLGG